jgi:NADH-quinone oxidoreductase subunit J
LRGDEDLGKASPPVSNLTKILVAVGLTAEFVFIIKSTIFTRAVPTGVMGGGAGEFGSAEQVAGLLFTRYLYPFELTSILLLAAIVGAVVIARKEKNEDSALPKKPTAAKDKKSENRK